jgi:hypothetical protein
VNNLVFSYTDLRDIVEESDDGENVFYINEVHETLWKATKMKNVIYIKVIRDPLEIESVLDGFGVEWGLES